MTTTKKLPSVEDVKKGHGRLTFQEAMSLISLPIPSSSSSTERGKRKKGPKEVTRRYMSRRRVWVTGEDLMPLAMEMGASSFKTGTSAYGGHVYSQAALAASKAFRATQREKLNEKSGDMGGNGKGKNFGIHTIHGFFSEAGHDDRPFIYEVTTLASNPLFPNLLVTARQPSVPSTSTERDFYPLADADLPLGPVCFSAMVSFRPEGISQLDAQESPPQERFREILQSRKPAEWNPSPITDIEGILGFIPGARKAVGMFPGLEMRKVDMTSYNKGRPMYERREIILYRLLAPLPANAPTSESGSEEESDGPDAHICAHAFGADRNGLLMIGNHAGYGNELGRAASLSYSFVVHVDAADAVMNYCSDDNEIDKDEGKGNSNSNSNSKSYTDGEWWLQETSFPRVQTGRGIVHSKIWSPRGVHVATEYQDGIIRRKPRPGDKVAIKERMEAFKL